LLRAAAASRAPVLLYGPPGTGKTAMVEAAFASGDGPGLETVICSADTTEADLLGTWILDPATRTYVWAPGPLHRSVLRNVPLFVDEIALADPRQLACLYALVDGRGMLHIPANPTLAPHPVGDRWALVAACNPHVPGANMSDALLDRFDHHILVESDWQLALDLGVPQNIVTIAQNLDKRRRKIDDSLTWSPQLRSLLSFKAVAETLGPDYAAANLVSKAPEHDRDEVLAAVKTAFPKVSALAVGKRY
jgi:MoxR-like ATPase